MKFWQWILVLIGFGISFLMILIVFGSTFFLCSLNKMIVNAGFREEWNDSYGIIHRDLSYGEKPNNRFDLYIPASADKNANHGLMLFIHGGGWSAGARGDVDFICKRYAKAGYITATLTYSLLQAEHPEINVTTMLDEIEACLAQIKTTATEMGYTIDKAALSGFSAGGHLSLLYSYSRVKSSPIELKFVFDQVGPVDFHLDSWQGNEPLIIALTGSLTGRTIDAEMIEKGEAEEAINSISPIAFITGESLPTLFAYGSKDPLVDITHPRKLVETLKREGVTYSYVEFPRSGHMLECDPSCRDRYHYEILRFAKQYFGY